jgi:hypothetical protein
MPDPEFPGKLHHQVVLHSGAGRSQYLRMGWELLRSGSHRAPGVGRQRRHGARGSGTTKPVVYTPVEEIRWFGEERLYTRSEEGQALPLSAGGSVR